MKKTSRETHRLNVAFIELQRTLRGWTFAELARRADIHPSTLTHIVTNGHPADLDTINRIAAVLQVPPHILHDQSSYFKPKTKGSVRLILDVIIPDHEPTKTLLVSLVQAISICLGIPNLHFEFEDVEQGSILVTVKGDLRLIAALIELFSFMLVPIGVSSDVHDPEEPTLFINALIFPADSLPFRVSIFGLTATIEQACFLAYAWRRFKEINLLSLGYHDDGSLRLEDESDHRELVPGAAPLPVDTPS